MPDIKYDNHVAYTLRAF